MRLTRYECARIIGVRAAQIGMSAPVFIDITQLPIEKRGNFMYIAALEMKAGVLDMVIRRPLPNCEYSEVKLSGMQLPDDVDAFIAMCESDAS